MATTRWLRHLVSGIGDRWCNILCQLVFACLYPEQFCNHLHPHFHQVFFPCWGPKIPHCKQYARDWKQLSDWLGERFVVVGPHGLVHINWQALMGTDYDNPWSSKLNLGQRDEILVVGPVTWLDYHRFSCLVSLGHRSSGNVSQPSSSPSWVYHWVTLAVQHHFACGRFTTPGDGILCTDQYSSGWMYGDSLHQSLWSACHPGVLVTMECLCLQLPHQNASSTLTLSITMSNPQAGNLWFRLLPSTYWVSCLVLSSEVSGPCHSTC